MPHSESALPASDSRCRLYLFCAPSQLRPPPGHEAADLAAYLPLLAADFALCLVVENGQREGIAAALAECDATSAAALAGVEICDEAAFLARQPEPAALALYLLADAPECAWQLDYVHAFPGVVALDGSALFGLHQRAAQQAGVNFALNAWLAEDGHLLPEGLLDSDGGLSAVPPLVQVECPMLRRVVASSRGILVGSRYAERRVRAAAEGLPLGRGSTRPLACLPRLARSPASALSSGQRRALLSGFAVADADFMVLVPGPFSAQRMLYEVLAAFFSAQPGFEDMQLVFAGDPDAATGTEAAFPLSTRISQLWPQGGGPVVTGPLSADAFDGLLLRADLTVLLRHPATGETTGLLARAALAGSQVVTVDAGALAEFESPNAFHIPVDGNSVAALIDVFSRARARRVAGGEREHRRAIEAASQAAAGLDALYPTLRALLEQAVRAVP